MPATPGCRCADHRVVDIVDAEAGLVGHLDEAVADERLRQPDGDVVPPGTSTACCSSAMKFSVATATWAAAMAAIGLSAMWIAIATP